MMFGFFLAILAGTVLLWLPFSTAEGETTSFLEAMFTATTSICVTGLVVVDTFSHWTLFGKIVILALIQIGGFGVITMYMLGLMMFQKQFSLKTRLLIQDYYNLDSIHGMVKFMMNVVRGTLIVELAGAVLYSFTFIPQFGPVKGAWISLFTSISAFCNAGIDIIGPSSLIPYKTQPWINLVTSALVILGGLGYVVWFDVLETVRSTIKRKISFKGFYRRLSEHSRLVLVLTAGLLISGTVLVLILEYHNPETIGELNFFQKVMVSFFQSMTFRTAGFASVPQQDLTDATSVVGLFYMFIGGSPVGTAGGVKTVTVFLVICNAVSYIRNRDEAVIMDRRITGEMVSKATAIITVSLLVTIVLIVGLCATNDVSPLAAAYEMFSATATVGLSQGLTPELNDAGRILVIIGMYAGRIGPISMAIFFNSSRSDKNDVNYAKGRFIVG
ncbi:MAG: potassium transporter TrkH [Lachnospiraceae bacterium]|nr:potassium transporter TrkH [Lachnospiraceae bacterium]